MKQKKANRILLDPMGFRYSFCHFLNGYSSYAYFLNISNKSEL